MHMTCVTSGWEHQIPASIRYSIATWIKNSAPVSRWVPMWAADAPSKFVLCFFFSFSSRYFDVIVPCRTWWHGVRCVSKTISDWMPYAVMAIIVSTNSTVHAQHYRYVYRAWVDRKPVWHQNCEHFPCVCVCPTQTLTHTVPSYKFAPSNKK